jgi:hypothetical protein
MLPMLIKKGKIEMINYLYEFKSFILSHPKAEADLNDILTDTDLSEENQIDELMVMMENYESHEGLKIPVADSDLKQFARFIRNHYLTTI